MRRLALAMIAISFLGFVDATYLSVKHFSHTTIPCSITHGCEIVTTSNYAEIFGIPVALLGSVYYLALLALSFVAWESKNEKMLRIATRTTAIGLLASVWFVYVQIGILQAICQWCMISATTSTTLFLLGYVVTPRVLRGAPALAPSAQE